MAPKRNKKKVTCVYCGKEFASKGAVASHIKSMHPNQQEAPEGTYKLNFDMPFIDEAGPAVIKCPICKNPHQVMVKDDGTLASSSEHKPPVKPSSSKGRTGAPLKLGAPDYVIAERYKMRWNKEESRWKRTIAMSGTHGRTAPEMPWRELGIDERWLLNDCHGIFYISPHVKAGRVDRWWQIHHRWRITRRATRHATDHWQWLQDVETVPRIVMQRKFAEVPASEGFPLREISEMFLGGKLGRGAGYNQYYFTNTFAYMFAQILYEKVTGIKDWERIELYGCELEQLETEYFRQRPGIEFWMGLLVAHGIEFYVPQSCFMLYAQDVVQNEYGQQKMVQYPGYMAYGFLSPSLEEAKAQNLPIGVDPREESVLMSWDDSPYTDSTYAMNEKLAWLQRAHDMSDFNAENDALNEWADSMELT